MKKAGKVNYALPFKKLFYAQQNEDADMCFRARDEIAANRAISKIRTMMALRGIKREVTAATKNGTLSALYEKWGAEIGAC